MGFYQTFSSRLKEARKKSGLSQKELADKVQVSQGTISAYEKGTGDKGSGPTIEKVARIAAALDVSLDWLCGADEQKPASAEIDPAAWLSYLFQLLDRPPIVTDNVPSKDPNTGEITIKERHMSGISVECPNNSSDVLLKGATAATISFYGLDMKQVFWNYLAASSLRHEIDDDFYTAILQNLVKRNAHMFVIPDSSEFGDLPI